MTPRSSSMHSRSSAGSGALQPPDAGWLPDDGGGLEQSGPDGDALRDRAPDWLERRRPVQSAAARYGRASGVPADRQRILLQCGAADAEPGDPRCARPGGLAAGMEHAVPVLAGVHAIAEPFDETDHISAGHSGGPPKVASPESI